jgi:hypothetical protein
MNNPTSNPQSNRKIHYIALRKYLGNIESAIASIDIELATIKAAYENLRDIYELGDFNE